MPGKLGNGRAFYLACVTWLPSMATRAARLDVNAAEIDADVWCWPIGPRPPLLGEHQEGAGSLIGSRTLYAGNFRN